MNNAITAMQEYRLNNDVPTKTKTSIRRQLLTTASALVIASAVFGTPLTARAEPASDKMWLSIEAQRYFVEGDDQIWTELSNGVTSSGIFNIDADDGWGGRVGVGIPVMPGLSVAAFARFGRTGDAKDQAAIAPGGPLYLYNVLGGGNPTFYYTGSVTHKERHSIIDFEARQDVGLGMGIEATIKGGVRFAKFEADTDTTLYYSPGLILNESRRTNFRGTGPRIGVDARIPVMAGVKLDLSGSGSYLWGKKRIKSFAAGGYVAAGGANVSNNDEVWNIEGSAAVTWVMAGAEISAGVRGEHWSGVFDQTRLFAFNSTLGDANADRTLWGPFVRLTLTTN